MNEYPVLHHATILHVVHCDMYRFTSASEMNALELEAYRRPDTVILVEWPIILPDVEWNADITVTLAHKGEYERVIDIQGI